LVLTFVLILVGLQSTFLSSVSPWARWILKVNCELWSQTKPRRDVGIFIYIYIYIYIYNCFLATGRFFSIPCIPKCTVWVWMASFNGQGKIYKVRSRLWSAPFYALCGLLRAD
jgi:hypothetical protein